MSREGAGWRFIDDIKVTQTQPQTVTSLALVETLRWMDGLELKASCDVMCCVVSVGCLCVGLVSQSD